MREGGQGASHVSPRLSLCKAVWWRVRLAHAVVGAAEHEWDCWMQSLADGKTTGRMPCPGCVEEEHLTLAALDVGCWLRITA